MGYFANGSEGTDYEQQYCERCYHQNRGLGGCAVWLAHLLYNYDQHTELRDALDLLIPRQADGIGNAECAMFLHDATRERDRNQPRLFEW